MRPVRFVALSEDGQALVLADEVGRLLTLPIDDRVGAAVRHEQTTPRTQFGAATDPATAEAALSPRDIQSRIRSGESAEEVARIAGVPVDRVLRYAGPVLQERAMLAQHARRTRLRSSERGATLAEIVDTRLTQHGVDAEGVSWDAYRRDDGTWRVTASWASGKATAQAVWALDKARQVVTPDDDMAQFLSTERPAPLLGQEPEPEPAARSGHSLTRPDAGRSRPEQTRPEPGGGHGLPTKTTRREVRRLPETARTTLDRPLSAPSRPGESAPARPAAEPLFPAPERRSADTGPTEAPARRAAEPLRPAGERRPNAEPLRPTGQSESARPAARSEPVRPAGLGEPRRSTSDTRGPGFVEDEADGRELPAVPSLAVLRPRRNEQGATGARSRLPSWDDVLFGDGNTQQGGR
ncbi:septation protein SepH [Actinocatenispora sera]|uniref:DNA-binding protein n=1 Tax=Actinocatenispora sera TaxID=390989 RepID=A0A810KUC4_9ACTN|nr:septation protein SepH [Actinocatenispora sera]BCJ26265.1 DNA-binding protein [Actinocatenispora sera]